MGGGARVPAASARDQVNQTVAADDWARATGSILSTVSAAEW